MQILTVLVELSDLQLVSIRPAHMMQFVSYDFLYYYAETKEIIYESVKLKGVVYN